ncbi:hypothetical protein [Bacillus sp. 1P02SD]|uniref:hypothetical protein n=1 Tax=Bacillus sp. 1P02SD TaxID=3132264 RepID=UPI0039A09145
MILRKFLGFVLTTLLTGLFLTLFFAIMDGFDNLFAAFGILLVGTAPFMLLIGLPVSIFSDYLTKNLNGKQRFKKAFLIYIIFGLIIGLVLCFFFEHFFLVVITIVASLIFWIVDEILRKKLTKQKNFSLK